MKLNIVVVLYNKTINQSKTISSLLDNVDLLLDAEVSLAIWNNGPHTIKDEVEQFISSQRFKRLIICEDVTNSSLSMVYNAMLDPDCTNIFFDDDTVITEDYVFSINDFMKSERDVFLPKIESLKQQRYPKVNKRTGNYDGELDELSVVSILSGLSIKKKTLKRLKDKFGNVFDERFNIYGVDTTLFYRLKSLKFDRYYVGGTLQHDLSGISAGGAENVSIFRVKERLWDFTLQTILYRKLGAFLGLMKFIKTYKSRLSIFFILGVFVKAIVYMGHPNTKKKSVSHILFSSNE
ncbi:hypothetical protein D210916BOD24_07890 [Alteromonas sp. D210916BOD_24]|uniref:hypothetical protein n=1 Tax=Alteromonas sp. D210916BOD_24 TaxID=3157618 RepID=UPI00399D484E